MRSIRFTSLLIFSSLLALSLCASYKTVIGVVGDFYDPKEKDEALLYYTVNSEIVRWIENSGAIVYVISPYIKKEEIKTELEKVDGVVFSGKKDKIFENVNMIPYDIIDAVRVLATDSGYSIPLFASGYAFKYLFLGNLQREDIEINNNKAKIVADLPRIKTSKLFNYLEYDDILSFFQGGEVFYHDKALTSLKAFNLLPNLVNTRRVTSLVEVDDILYINSVEDYEAAIYGTQFRPEAIGFERSISVSAPIDQISFAISRGIANFIVSEAAKKSRNFNFADNEPNLLDPNATVYQYIDGEYYMKFSTPKPKN